MNELKTYKKKLLKNKLDRMKNLFEEKEDKTEGKNIILRLSWKAVSLFLQAFFGIFLYVEYFFWWKIKDFTFDMRFMQYRIQARGMTPDEALTFLSEMYSNFKYRIARNSISKSSQSEAEKAFDHLFYEYNRLGNEANRNNADNITTRTGISITAQWIDTVWQNLVSYRCVINEDKADFTLVMRGLYPTKKITWSKGLVKLVQLIEEGIETGKIQHKGLSGQDDFITDYITTYFYPNPNIPNQKLEHYTKDRIRTALNERLKIPPKERNREFFVFD